ncbi:MAG: hypothetical protein WCJ30_23535, partial [Deltaproteobacteria bacterium]
MNRPLASLPLSLLVAAAALVAACSPRRDFDVAPVDATGVDVAADFSQGCPAPLAVCGDQCVNLQTDPTNCATCGHACGAAQGCVAGVCAVQCPIPEAACGGLCTSTQTDRFNCGACGSACP